MIDPQQVIEEARQIDRRRSRLLRLAGIGAFGAVALIALMLYRSIDNQDKILTLGEVNHQLLAEHNAELQAQVDASRVILTQLYAALNASQKQVADLGGVPIHFEFEVPTTTTTTTVPNKPDKGSTTSQGASSPVTTVALVFAIEALIISPITVALPSDVTVPPELTLPPVSIPPEITVPPPPDVTSTIPDTLPIGVPST